MNQRIFTPLASSDRGFSLIELMVSIVIGMLGVIIMMQVFSNTENQRRATTGMGDAQSNSAMAVYALQRDIRQAGQGFNATNVLGCALALPAPASRTLSQLASVIVNPPTADVPAGDVGTDTLLVFYGNADGSTEGDFFSGDGINLEVANISSYKISQRVIAAPASPVLNCTLNLSNVSALAGNVVKITPQSANILEGSLFNLGVNPKIMGYAVRAGNLTVCDYAIKNCSVVGNWDPIVNNIVSLQAQYGRVAPSAGSDQGVSIWDKTTPSASGSTDPLHLPCLWARVKAVRIAVVARNGAYSKDDLYTNTDAEKNIPMPVWEGVNIDLSNNANWNHYRHKVVETTIPLRNIPWMASCSK